MSYPGQQTGKKDTPTLAGLTLTAFSGIIKAAAGVLSGGATTTDLPEGSNLYYTDTRADARISAQKGAANGLATLDASGLVPLTQIPPAALERLLVVANQAARFALTTSSVQNGDTVLQTDTGVMYFVTDQTQLGSAAGYQQYTAGTASSVPWSGVTGTPTTIAGYGITDAKKRIVNTYSANQTLTSANDLVLVTATATITLVTPVGNSGLWVTIKNTGTGTVTVSTPAGTIDGASNYVINDQYEDVELVSDGTNWYAI
jgi:hypothetical protein